MMKKYLLLVLLFISGLFISGCCPTAPAYPDGDWTTIENQAQTYSTNLETYVKDWMAGKVPKELPSSMVLPGINPADIKNFYLINPANMTAEQQWSNCYREADGQVNLNSIKGSHWDPHATYMVYPALYAPFGTKVTIKGQFPKCRYFCVQIAPPLDRVSYYKAWWGSGEVPIVDVDIEPDPGSVNPFRIGQPRNATNRNYTIAWTMAIGNTNDLETQCKPPYYRGGGNHRYGGGIHYGGPWGDPAVQSYIKVTGKWDCGTIWVRMYRPDANAGLLAGGGFPKISYTLPDGRAYFIHSDFSGWVANASKFYPCRTTDAAEATADQLNQGYAKQFGILLAVTSGLATSFCNSDWAYVRNLIKGVEGRGEAMPAPGNWENSATCFVHCNYLLKYASFSLGANKVVTLTGKLPTFPKTRNGENFTAAQMRYWSMTGYDSDGNTMGYALNSVCDDELVLNSNREYVICYSRSNEKPNNATAAAGVTWVNWGGVAMPTFTLRWSSVNPDHIFAQSPTENNLIWSKTTQAGTQYDHSIIGTNDHTGFLGAYKPIWKTFKKTTFEGIGSTVTLAKVEAIANDTSSGCGTAISGTASDSWVVLLPLILVVFGNVIWFRRRIR